MSFHNTNTNSTNHVPSFHSDPSEGMPSSSLTLTIEPQPRMENPNCSATPPQTLLLFATQPVHPLHQPMLWVEMALQGRAPIFSMDINSRIHHNTLELKLLNPVDHRGDETSHGELCQSNVVDPPSSAPCNCYGTYLIISMFSQI
ncbi:hypothetical protein H5410_043209 [Solanum commersonii]|uniref:Uncharacterized protein n=1 Tax=Solanum commersonii TaxID=4109 RepID=A0A9J5XYK0_SOLCO|nr:hypothetical protein H5410_043209 [Solanum commersonii]